MDRETEMLMEALQQFLALHSDEVTDEDSIGRLTDRFLAGYGGGPLGRAGAVPETADDYLELAELAPSKKKCLDYLHKALELEPDHVDAKLQLIVHTLENKPEELFPALRTLMTAAAEPLERAGCFTENAGDLWRVWETRPYLRVRRAYLDALIACGRMRRAVDEGEEILRLCENDELGVRYQLMHLYAFLEDEPHALALHERYGLHEETQMLLPLAVLYYKLDQCDKAEDCLKRLALVNKDTKKFFRAAVSGRLDPFLKEMDPYGYRPFTMDELLEDLILSPYLFSSVPHFFRWGTSYLRTQTTARRKKAAAKTQP